MLLTQEQFQQALDETRPKTAGWSALYVEDEPAGKCKNVLPNETDTPVQGDWPWEYMNTALGNVIKEYQEIWNRKPYVEEIFALVDSVGLMDAERLKTRGLEYYKETPEEG